MEVTESRSRGRPRNEERQSQREDEILTVATRLFAQRGYAETDIESVALKLGIGKGTIYRYFPSKRELFLAALNRGMQRLWSEVNSRVAPVVDPLERIVQAIYAFLQYFEQHPHLVDLFVQELAQANEREKPAYFVHHDEKSKPWREMYRQMVDAGRVRDIPAADDHNVMNDLLYGTILANRFTGRPTSHEVQARTIVDLCFNGLLTDAERERRRAFAPAS